MLRRLSSSLRQRRALRGAVAGLIHTRPQRDARHLDVLLVLTAVSGATRIARAEQQADDEEAEPEPLPDVKPFVALFLDDESRARLKKRYPETAGLRSASYVLLEPTEVTSDITRPAIFAPLMGERGKIEVVSKRTDSNGLTTLRVKVRVAGGEIEGMGGYEPSISWGGANDDDVAHDGAKEGDEGFVKVKSPLKLTGTVCRAEYWHGAKCHLQPLMECPLCAYMKQSPCKVPFTAWEDCLNASEAKGGTDEERQARFITDCAEQTLALKECVDKYPEFFGNMFGGAPPAEATETEPETEPQPEAKPEPETAAADNKPVE